MARSWAWLHQCSIRDAASENAKRILSVCNLNADCSFKVAVDIQRLQKSTAEGECDGVCIFERDKIAWVKKGKPSVDVGGKLPYGSKGGTDATVLLKAGIDTENAVIKATISREDAAAYCRIHGDGSTKDCLSEMARYARTLKPEIRANCSTKQFTDFSAIDMHFLELIRNETKTTEKPTRVMFSRI